MAKALIRYWAYDSCLKNHSIRYTWKDLQAKANQDLEDQDYEAIKKTQFFKDIKALKAPPYNAPIETYKISGRSYYRYSDPRFSIRQQKLNELEAQQIKSALMVLGRFKGVPQFDWVQEVIPKIEQNFGLKDDSSQIIGFDQNVDLKGLEYIGELFNAILYKRVIKISYQSFKSPEPVEIIVHPYYLKQYNNRWFLFGQTSQFSSLSIFSLDRIFSTETTSSPYITNNKYDFEEYFEDIIGVSIPADRKPEVLTLWFTQEQAPYVLTKPLHGSQKKKKHDESGLVITIEVVPNFELEQMILSYGENCRVIEPEHLRTKIRDRLGSAVALY